MKYTGNIRKMVSEYRNPVHYSLPIGESLLPLNDQIGKSLSITFDGKINCIACGRPIKKSYNQGYCFPCVRSLAECDMCIVRPEQCHFDKGTCRDEKWALSHCMQKHIVYLSNSSEVKVGITRQSQVPTRWIDQGAVQALPLYRVKNRQISGLVEVILKSSVSDKTNWRKMLQCKPQQVDLSQFRDRIIDEHRGRLEELMQSREEGSIEAVEDGEAIEIHYPVSEYPDKISSLNLDKNPSIQSKLVGIKGQYMIFTAGVINIRKYAGYSLQVEI